MTNYKTHFRKLIMAPSSMEINGAAEPTSPRRMQMLEIFFDELKDFTTDYACEIGIASEYEKDDEWEGYQISREEARKIDLDRYRSMFFTYLDGFSKLTNCDARDVTKAFAYDHQTLYDKYVMDLGDVDDLENVRMLSEMCTETDAYIRARLAGERYIDTKISTHLNHINRQNPYPPVKKSNGLKPPEHG